VGTHTKSIFSLRLREVGASQALRKLRHLFFSSFLPSFLPPPYICSGWECVVMHYCIPSKRKEKKRREKKHPIQLESTGWRLKASDNWDSPYRLEKIFPIFFFFGMIKGRFVVTKCIINHACRCWLNESMQRMQRLPFSWKERRGKDRAGFEWLLVMVIDQRVIVQCRFQIRDEEIAKKIHLLQLLN